MYNERIIKLINENNMDLYKKVEKFIDVNYHNMEYGLIHLETFSKDVEAFDNFKKILGSVEDGDLERISNDIIGLNLVFKYSKEELEEFFNHTMTADEIERINDLGLNDIISKITNDNYKIKYINNVGYVLISSGHLILDDGSEPVCYFAQIFRDSDFTKKVILKDNKSND